MGSRLGDYHDMAAQVRRADALGFHGVWLGERHLANGDLLWPSPMSAAAFFAAQTQRIRIGLAARILPFHHPLQVAADVLTLDVLTRGRFDLGLSRGSMDEQSHVAFGVSRDEARRRFDEHLAVLRLACRGEPFSYRGRYFDLDAVVVGPPPVQRPHPPLFFVANHPDSLDAAAAEGLPVFLNGALDTAGVAATVRRYQARAAATDLAPGGELLLNRFIFVGETTEAARRTMREPFRQFLAERAPDLKAYLLRTFGDAGIDFDFLAQRICIFGDADHCAARIAELRERAGVEHFLFSFNLITLDHARSVESMERFALDVLPRLVPASVAAAPRPHLREVSNL